MFRSTITLATLTALLISTLTPPTQACNNARYPRRTTYARPHPVHNVVQPVHVLRPTVVVRPAVAPAIVPPPQELPTVPAGSTMTLPANFLGNLPGSVFMVFGKIKLPVEIKRWTMTGVTIALPPMAIKNEVVVRVDIVLPDGKLGHSQELRVTAPAPIVLHPVNPTAPLPTQPALATTVLTNGIARPTQAAATTSSPILLAPAQTSPQTGTAEQPIVLPAASQPVAQTVAAQPALQGQGTPSQPFVLPAAQPVSSNSNPPAATPAVEIESAPAASGDEAINWLENNPILMEGLRDDSATDAAPSEPVEPSVEPIIEQTVEAQPSSASSAASVSSMASIFATVAKVLLTK